MPDYRVTQGAPLDGYQERFDARIGVCVNVLEVAILQEGEQIVNTQI